jgi:hypothetical protein
LAALGLTGCGQLFLPLPPQRTAPEFRIRKILKISAGPNPDAVVLRDVEPLHPGLDWSWTGAHPGFRFKLPTQTIWSLQTKLTVADTVLKETGPQQVQFFVNGAVVGNATLDQPRTYNLTFPVDPALLQNLGAVNVDLSVTPCLPQPNGNAYCLLLHEIGFVGLLPEGGPH